MTSRNPDVLEDAHIVPADDIHTSAQKPHFINRISKQEPDENGTGDAGQKQRQDDRALLTSLRIVPSNSLKKRKKTAQQE